MPPTDPRKPSFRFTGPTSWTNRHENVVQPLRRLYEVENMTAPGQDLVADIRPTVTMLQGILADAIRDGAHVRALGGAWSLSMAAATDGYLIDTKQLNWYFRLGAASIAPAYQGDRAGLLFLQCGMSVYEANKYLDQTYGRALKTTGAANGQTILGAISTGTHGSAFNVGAMPDYVVGMHIIVGPDRHIWLERASGPAVSDAFVSRLGAELVRNDTQFNAALVSFGSFGIIHAVLVETEPTYLLETYQHRLPLESVRHAMATLDFTGLPMPHVGETPHHFEIDVNPHDIPNGVWMSVMYKRQLGPYTPPDKTPGSFGPGDDLLSFIGTLTPLIKGGVAPIINAFAKEYLKDYSNVRGKQGEIFSKTIVHGKAMSMELGLPLTSVAAALPIILDAARSGSFPGLIGIRYVKRSRALLAFTKFDLTCTVELQGAYSTLSQGVYDRIWSMLEAERIPFTLHWGQINGYLTPARTQAMYGAAADLWRQSRKALLSPAAQIMFSSAFLEKCGLAT